jgi:hypothetical protein
MAHQFKTGQIVRLSQGISARTAPRTEFKVVRQLPEVGGEVQYRIKADRETFERVVVESALEKA